VVEHRRGPQCRFRRGVASTCQRRNGVGTRRTLRRRSTPTRYLLPAVARIPSQGVRDQRLGPASRRFSRFAGSSSERAPPLCRSNGVRPPNVLGHCAYWEGHLYYRQYWVVDKTALLYVMPLHLQNGEGFVPESSLRWLYDHRDNPVPPPGSRVWLACLDTNTTASHSTTLWLGNKIEDPEAYVTTFAIGHLVVQVFGQDFRGEPDAGRPGARRRTRAAPLPGGSDGGRAPPPAVPRAPTRLRDAPTRTGPRVGRRVAHPRALKHRDHERRLRALHPHAVGPRR
jgi:hypothetical protein